MRRDLIIAGFVCKRHGASRPVIGRISKPEGLRPAAKPEGLRPAANVSRYDRCTRKMSVAISNRLSAVRLATRMILR
jgi:hypothetical protein